jgi:hypothetical protein
MYRHRKQDKCCALIMLGPLKINHLKIGATPIPHPVQKKVYGQRPCRHFATAPQGGSARQFMQHPG